MARNGSGVMSVPYPDFVSGTTIVSGQVDANNADIVAELTNSIAADGQTTITANIPMNSKKFTGLAVGSAATDSAHLGQVQAEAYIWCGTAGGTADAITLSPTPAITAYAAGQRFVFVAASANTTATTAAISGLTTKAIQRGGSALVANDILASRLYVVVYDGTALQLQKFSLTAAEERTGLGLGTMATQAASAVAITGGTVAGITDLAVADGGTGASTFTDAGVLIGNAAGAIQVTSAGTAGQVLTSNGAGVDPTFQAASGKVKQMVSTVTGAVATGTTVMVIDDTIPQNTEGDQYMTLAITPTSATNNLLITVVVNIATSVAGFCGAALFQDTTANALASGFEAPTGTNNIFQLAFDHVMVAGTTSATTFKVRAGPTAAGTLTFNGQSGARLLGGVCASSITIMEIAP